MFNDTEIIPPETAPAAEPTTEAPAPGQEPQESLDNEEAKAE